jgi:hypothetical protein
MKTAVVKSSTLAAAGRWDAKYHITLAEHLRENGMEETPETVQIAMKAIREWDTATMLKVRDLRARAAVIAEEARSLEQSAELTYPHGYRP